MGPVGLVLQTCILHTLDKHCQTIASHSFRAALWLNGPESIPMLNKSGAHLSTHTYRCNLVQQLNRHALIPKEKPDGNHTSCKL